MALDISPISAIEDLRETEVEREEGTGEVRGRPLARLSRSWIDKEGTGIRRRDCLEVETFGRSLGVGGLGSST